MLLDPVVPWLTAQEVLMTEEKRECAEVQLQIEQFGGYGDNGTWKKQRQISYVVAYMWNLKKKMIQMNLLTKQEQTHSLWKPTYGYQRRNVG